MPQVAGRLRFIGDAVEPLPSPAVSTELILLGSIGVLAETSDIQRRAYNQAMADAGLGWSWDENTYRRLLTMSGGRERLRLLADATGTELSDDAIASIHARKTDLACAEVVDTPVPLRPGVAEIVQRTLDAGIAIGLVTSTYRPNIDAIAAAAGDALPLDRFAVVVSRDDVARGKPAPDAYRHALDRTGADPAATVAIEDTAASAIAASTTGIRVIAAPGSLSAGQVIPGAAAVVEQLGGSEGLNSEVEALLFG